MRHSSREDHGRCEMAGLAKAAQMISCCRRFSCLHVDRSQQALFRGQPVFCAGSFRG